MTNASFKIRVHLHDKKFNIVKTIPVHINLWKHNTAKNAVLWLSSTNWTFKPHKKKGFQILVENSVMSKRPLILSKKGLVILLQFLKKMSYPPHNNII